MINLAKDVATKAHAGQQYGTGESYIVHPTQAAVMAQRLGYPDEVVVACYLHDVLEDTAVTEDKLRKLFSDVVVEAVLAVTFMGKNSVAKIDKAMSHSLAHVVKFCDASSNFANVVISGPVKGNTMQDMITRYTYYLSRLGENLPSVEEVNTYLSVRM